MKARLALSTAPDQLSAAACSPRARTRCFWAPRRCTALPGSSRRRLRLPTRTRRPRRVALRPPNLLRRGSPPAPDSTAPTHSSSPPPPLSLSRSARGSGTASDAGSAPSTTSRRPTSVRDGCAAPSRGEHSSATLTSEALSMTDSLRRAASATPTASASSTVRICARGCVRRLGELVRPLLPIWTASAHAHRPSRRFEGRDSVCPARRCRCSRGASPSMRASRARLTLTLSRKQMAHFGKTAQPYSREAFDLLSLFRLLVLALARARPHCSLFLQAERHVRRQASPSRALPEGSLRSRCRHGVRAALPLPAPAQRLRDPPSSRTCVTTLASLPPRHTAHADFIERAVATVYEQAGAVHAGQLDRFRAVEAAARCVARPLHSCSLAMGALAHFGLDSSSARRAGMWAQGASDLESPAAYKARLRGDLGRRGEAPRAN